MMTKTVIKALLSSTFFFLKSSITNRMTQSASERLIKGINKLIVAKIVSIAPYSSVVSQNVYKGTNKKLINLLPKLATVNIPEFTINFLYLFIITCAKMSLVYRKGCFPTFDELKSLYSKSTYFWEKANILLYENHTFLSF